MPRRTSSDRSIAERIKTRRELRGWSVRYAASRAGISHTTWSRIERGLLPADNRFMAASIASALECSVADLFGYGVTPTDPVTASAQASVPAILQALIETDLNDPATCEPRPLAAVGADAALIWELRLRCDYAGAGRILPAVLRELHALARGAERVEALRLLARTADAASFLTRYVGYPAEAWLASNRAREAARALEDPVILGLAAWSLGHAAIGCGSYGRALGISETAIRDIEPHYDAPGAPEMLGSLHMLAAFTNCAEGRRDDAAAWARESSTIADRTGDSDALGLNFGPTNLNCWWISMEVDGGDPGRAVEIAQQTQPTSLTVSRQAAFYADTGRALARLESDDKAVRMLLIAERMAPQRMRSSPLLAETARGLLARSRRGSRADLRGLCERLGITD